MPYCRYCGNSVKPGEEYCSSCGKTPDGEEVTTIEERESNDLPGWARAAVLVAVVIIFVALLIKVPSRVPSSSEPLLEMGTASLIGFCGNIPANFLYGDSVAFQKDWMYFSVGNHTQPYKSRKDGTEKTLLCQTDDLSGAGCIQIIGDWVYFSKYHKGSNHFYRIKTNGSNLMLLDDLAGDGSVIVAGDNFYYVNYEHIDKKTIIGSIVKHTIGGVTKDVLYKSKSPQYTLSIQKVNEEGILFLEKDEENRRALYHINLDGNNLTEIFDHSSGYYFYRAKVIGDRLFFYDCYSHGGLYYVDLSNFQVTEVYSKEKCSYWKQEDFIIVYNKVGQRYIGRYDSKLVAFDQDLERYNEINTDEPYNVFKDQNDDEWIYYSDYSGLYRVRIDGSGWSQLH